VTIDYSAIKTLHLICVGISLSGFCWRAWRVLQGQAIPKALQRLPHLVDSLLLASGFTLLWQTEFAWLQQTWMLIKLSALPFYILFGALALNYSAPQYRRRYLVLALATALAMVLLATLKPQ
tara:strand:+ start:1269 stop:1634 length:366 start_codon:yes stop_codon:yes gene_type:complete